MGLCIYHNRHTRLYSDFRRVPFYCFCRDFECACTILRFRAYACIQSKSSHSSLHEKSPILSIVDLYISQYIDGAFREKINSITSKESRKNPVDDGVIL